MRSSFISVPALVCIALASLAGFGCSDPPPYMTLGEHESYCGDHADCDPGLFCLQVDGTSSCTGACASDDDCEDSYTCSRSEGICRPAPGAMCRGADARCGPSFAPCCSGFVCATFPPFGAYCTTRCGDDYDCSSSCCAAAGTDRICGPPSLC